MTDHTNTASPRDLRRFADFVRQNRRLFVLTGAGISRGSGIPVYRDDNGDWLRAAPVQFRDFVERHATRQRYWARSLVGWNWFARAKPNICHYTLSRWEHNGWLSRLITQNVDRLHQQAGARNVIDLHGRLDRVVCMVCDATYERATLQQRLLDDNPMFVDLAGEIAPDGDARIEQVDFSLFRIPDCEHCGGLLKPDVVFFGETLPRPVLDAALAALDEADAILVIGSSLMVYSGFRFCRLAHQRNLPIAAVNPGRTRADALFSLKLEHRFEDIAAKLPEDLGGA